MPLEVANFINQLDPANPAAPDLMADTDNHLRLIKQVVKNTFPNVTGPVTVSQHTLNGSVPIGGIIMWSGALNTIPAGWVLCAGQTLGRTDGGGNIQVPDLRDRFIVGAGLNYSVGQTGGAVAQTGTTSDAGAHVHGGSTDTQGSHSHGGKTQDHVLSINQIPTHKHQISYSNATSPNTGGYGFLRGGKTGESGEFCDERGGNQAHSHGIGADGSHAHSITTDTQGNHNHVLTVQDGRPPFYALAFIIKV